MQRQWWFLSAKRDGFSLSGAGGACGFLCICALNGAQFLKLAVHKCFCFSLVSIPLRVLFLMSLPSWWTPEKTMCGGDKVALYFCFSLTSIFLRLLFPASFTFRWTLKRTMCGGDRVALYFCFSLTSIFLRVFDGWAFLALLEVSHLCYKAQRLYLIVTVSPLSQNRWGNSDAVNVSSEKTCYLLE